MRAGINDPSVGRGDCDGETSTIQLQNTESVSTPSSVLGQIIRSAVGVLFIT
jgi:hypothetical protein